LSKLVRKYYNSEYGRAFFQYIPDHVKREARFWAACVGNMPDLLASTEFVPDRFRSNKESAKELITYMGTEGQVALGFIDAELRQDPEILVLCGLLKDRTSVCNGVTDNTAPVGDDIVYSVKFSLHADASQASNVVYKHMQEVFGTGRHFWPNAFSIKFCGDPDGFTKEAGHCFGTCGMICHKVQKKGELCTPATNGTHPPMTCQQAIASVKPYVVTNHSCWAMGFRTHQQRSKDNDGYMVQVVEQRRGAEEGEFPERWGPCELGPGQRIENKMAADVGLKVFQLEIPEFPESEEAFCDGKGRRIQELIVRKQVERLTKAVKRWRDERRRHGCDPSITHLECPPMTADDAGEWMEWMSRNGLCFQLGALYEDLVG